MRWRRQGVESTRTRIQSLVRGTPTHTRVFLFIVGLAASAGCGWLQPAQHVELAARAPEDLATSVSVVGTPFHRILMGGGDAGPSTRLVILYVRLENTADEVFVTRPGEITLLQADGTVGVGLDRERALALLERRDLLIVDAEPAMRDLGGWDRTRAAQDELRDTIRDELLTDSEVERAHPVGGYLIVDLRQAQYTLEGATLLVGLTRLVDGAPLRQLYRFDTTPVATAETPPGAAQ